MDGDLTNQMLSVFDMCVYTHLYIEREIERNLSRRTGKLRVEIRPKCVRCLILYSQPPTQTNILALFH